MEHFHRQVQGECYICRDPCNEMSQVCGRCMRVPIIRDAWILRDESQSYTAPDEPEEPEERLDSLVHGDELEGDEREGEEKKNVLGDETKTISLSQSQGNEGPQGPQGQTSQELMALMATYFSSDEEDEFHPDVPTTPRGPQKMPDEKAVPVILACIVCQLNQINAVTIPCRHACFCNECSGDYLKMSGKCPICRESLTSIEHIYISSVPVPTPVPTPVPVSTLKHIREEDSQPNDENPSKRRKIGL
jgi:hypothetical protein